MIEQKEAKSINSGKYKHSGQPVGFKYYVDTYVKKPLRWISHAAAALLYEEFLDKMEARSENSETENAVKIHIPKEAYDKIVTYLGPAVDNYVSDLKAGLITEEQFINIADQIELYHERNRGHRDIGPEEWQDFEEGYRPD